MNEVPCRFVYSTGKRCTGHVLRMAAFKADLSWNFQEDGTWRFSTGRPRSHYHLYCSAKGNHAGALGEDRLKFYFDQLPADLRKIAAESP